MLLSQLSRRTRTETLSTQAIITGAQPKAGTGLKMQTVRFFGRLEKRETGIRNPESGIGTGIGTGTGTGTGTGEGTGMGRKTYIKTGTTFTLIEVNLNLIPVQIYEC